MQCRARCNTYSLEVPSASSVSRAGGVLFERPLQMSYLLFHSPLLFSVVQQYIRDGAPPLCEVLSSTEPGGTRFGPTALHTRLFQGGVAPLGRMIARGDSAGRCCHAKRRVYTRALGRRDYVA